MRNLVFILPAIFFLLNPESTIAQQPEKIYGKNKVLKSNEYYLEQMVLWKKVLDKNPKNADAWFNYYLANRNAYIVGEERDAQQSKGKTRFDRLKDVVLQMEKYVPGTYEYNFVKWMNGNNDLSLFPFLEKAHQLSPSSPGPLMSLMFYYEIKGDYTLRDKYTKAYYGLGDYSPGLLNYAYNMLSGLREDAIIFTEGDKDTEAILLLQKGKGFRDDVRMVNLNLLLIEEYRERIFAELQIPSLEFNPLENEENYRKFQETIVKQFTKNGKNRPVYTAITVSEPYTKPVKMQLYLTGLEFLYSETKTDNIALLKRNVEQLYALDYLKVYFPKDISEGNVNSMNGNYLLPFYTLSEHYRLAGDVSRSDYYKSLARKISVAANLQVSFEAYFGKP